MKFYPFVVEDQIDMFEQPSIDELIAQHSLDRLAEPCNNCGSVDWAGKNDDYCTTCEREWWKAWRMTCSPCDNPKQELVDKILKEYGI